MSPLLAVFAVFCRELSAVRLSFAAEILGFRRPNQQNISERLAVQPLFIVQWKRLDHSKAPAPPANLETHLISS
jgi:hypothetical protein